MQQQAPLAYFKLLQKTKESKTKKRRKIIKKENIKKKKKKNCAFQSISIGKERKTITNGNKFNKGHKGQLEDLRQNGS